MQIENAMSRFAEQARGRYDELVTGAQRRANEAAGRISKGKKPVKTLSKLGLKLTAVSHRTADKVLKQNSKMVEHQIDAFAGRLKAAAAASDVRDLVSTQVRLIPENAASFVSDARDALSIVTGAGGEVKDLFKGTIDELRGRAPARRKAAKKTATRRPANKAATQTKVVVDENKAA